MMSTVIGGAMLPHAPQFFTMPETEDKKNVEHVREVAADVGKKLRALEPDLTSTAKIDYAIGIPLTHLGHTDPVLPIYVNAYLPPQPTMERCYAFGQAVARTVTALGLKTVVLASGGMSHFPGTDRYANPELDWDTRALEKLK